MWEMFSHSMRLFVKGNAFDEVAIDENAPVDQRLSIRVEHVHVPEERCGHRSTEER